MVKQPSIKVGELKESFGPSSTLRLSNSDCKYLVTVSTLDAFSAETVGPIYMQLFGDNGETTMQPLANPREKDIDEQFRRGQRESYFLRGKDIGAINGYAIENKSNDNWIAEYISVEKLDQESKPIEGTKFVKEGNDPVVVENGIFSTRDKFIAKKFDHTKYDAEDLTDLVKKLHLQEQQRMNPDGTLYKVNVSMTNEATIPPDIDFDITLNSVNGSTEPTKIKMNPKQGTMYQYSVFGTKLDKIKNVKFQSDQFVREQWFDYVEVIHDQTRLVLILNYKLSLKSLSHFMLPNMSHSNDQTVHFETGNKYFIRIFADEDFIYEPLVSLRLLGHRTTSPVLIDDDMFDKKHKKNLLQMIVNDEQVGRLQAIEVSNQSKVPFTIDSIKIEQCNKVVPGEYGMKYDWEHAYEYV